MNRVALSGVLAGASPFARWAIVLRQSFFWLFLLQFGVVWFRLWRPSFLFGDARWPDGLLIVLMAATTLATLTRQLPGQNVMLASIIIAVIAGAVQSLGGLTGIPFGPFVYTDRIGQQLFDPLPWAVPVLWLVAILNSRGTARLVLRPWRETQNYGFWLLGATVALVVLLDFGLEAFASQVKHYWAWSPTKLKLDWYGAPWVNFLGWALTSVLILAFATPALIKKKPVKHSPDYQPLIVWLLVNVLFATAAAAHHLWPAFGLTVAASLVVAALAVRGGFASPHASVRLESFNRPTRMPSISSTRSS
jgi:putative membrane protein